MSANTESISDITQPYDETTETITAIATPAGVGGLGIVRVSGPEAFAVGLRIFRSDAISPRE